MLIALAAAFSLLHLVQGCVAAVSELRLQEPEPWSEAATRGRVLRHLAASALFELAIVLRMVATSSFLRGHRARRLAAALLLADGLALLISGGLLVLGFCEPIWDMVVAAFPIFSLLGKISLAVDTSHTLTVLVPTILGLLLCRLLEGRPRTCWRALFWVAGLALAGIHLLWLLGGGSQDFGIGALVPMGDFERIWLELLQSFGATLLYGVTGILALWMAVRSRRSEVEPG